MCWSCKELTDAQFRIIPKIMHPATYRTWILPSSRRLRFLHLIIHVKYVTGQMILIRCCFAITIMVDTIFSTSSRNSFKFLQAIGTVHHVLLQHLDSYSNHAMFFPAQVGGGIHENFILASSCALHIYIYMCVCVCACISFWLISLYL